MNTKDRKKYRRHLLMVTTRTLAVGLGIAGCDLQAPVTAELTAATDTAAGIGTVSGGFTLISIQAKTPVQFTTVGTTAFFNARTLAVIGTCDRGISAIQVTLNNVSQPMPFNCPTVGNISFTITVPSDGLYAAVFTPLGADSSPFTSGAITQNIYAKTTSPPAVIVTTTAPDVVAPGPTEVDGTVSTTVSDYVVGVTESTGSTISVNTTTGVVRSQFSIVQGQSITLSFRAVDIVGNLSSTTNFNVSTSNAMKLNQFVGSGLTTPKASGAHNMRQFTSGPVLQASGGGVPTASSGNKMYVGIPSDDVAGP